MRPRLNGQLFIDVLRFVRNCLLRVLTFRDSECKGTCEAKGWKPASKEKEASGTK